MNKKVDEEFIGIKDIYVLQCTCTELKQEIERLKEEAKEWKHNATRINNENNKLHFIIKEVREYIEEHTENIDRGRYYEDYVETYPILEILDKVGNE